MATNTQAWRFLYRATWFALISHFLAGLAMAVILRHGLDTNPDFVAKMAFIADHPLQWTVAWLIWHVAALSILVFYYGITQAYQQSSNTSNPIASIALWICAAAIATDLAAQSIELGVLPLLAKGALTESPEQNAFVVTLLRRVVIVLTGYLGNGLYTIAASFVVFATRSLFRPWITAAGCGVVAAGLALSITALLDSTIGMVWSNAVLVPLILLWQVGILITSRRTAQVAGPQ